MSEAAPSNPEERVLFILNRVDDESGGTLTATINLAEALACGGIDVTISAPIRRRSNLNAVRRADPAVSRRLFATSGPSHRIGGSLRQAVWLARSVRRFTAVHIHSTFYLAALYTSWLCRLHNVPFFLWPHSSLDPHDVQKRKRLKKFTGRLLFGPMIGAARCLICTTLRESTTLVTFGVPVRTLVVPLPVSRLPRSNGAQWRERHGIDSDAFLVLFLGRIDRKKGLSLLIDAMSRMLEARRMLVIAGSGDSNITSALKQQVDGVGLSEAVKFVGWLDTDERSGAYAASDVFVLPSSYENFGIAVVEAILSDVPVVISEQVYICEDLVSVDGAYVVARTPADIAAALSEVASNRHEALVRAGRARAFAEATYSPAAVVAALRASGTTSGEANAGFARSDAAKGRRDG